MNFILFDLEATCWQGISPDGIQEVIEIGAFKINRYGKILDSFHLFVKPVVNPLLSPYCRNLTSIVQEQVDKAPKFKRAINSFLEWIEQDEEDFLLCSWGHFDQVLMQSECQQNGIDTDWLDHYIDLKRQYQEIKGLNRPKGLKNVVEREGFEFTGTHHRALDDTENLVKVFKKYLDEWMY